jgi:hypothetical protein
MNYPRATLFAFATTTTAADALSVAQRALQAQRSEKAVQEHDLRLAVGRRNFQPHGDSDHTPLPMELAKIPRIYNISLIKPLR